jgi:cobalamin biosynthesis protein CobD/CbiB
MNEQIWQCERCGGRKTLFFERAPRRLIVGLLVSAAVGVILYLVILPSVTGIISREIAIYLGMLVAGFVAFSALRIRCLKCEPQRRVKMHEAKASGEDVV